jgi:hypothetical protein
LQVLLSNARLDGRHEGTVREHQRYETPPDTSYEARFEPSLAERKKVRTGG